MKKDWAVRGFHVLLLLTILTGIEGLRLAWLQLGYQAGVRTAIGSVSQSATRQRADNLLLESGRGQFRDRSGRLLTGQLIDSFAAFPLNGMPRGYPQQLEQAAASLGVQTQKLEQWLEALREPEVWTDQRTGRAMRLSKEQISAIKQAQLLGAVVLPYENRYTAEITPIHAIGYISQHPERVSKLYSEQIASRRMRLSNPIGGAGLEKSMDRILQGLAPTIAKQITDGSRRPLEGLGLRIERPDNPHFPLQVITTLDLDVQTIAEKAMEKFGISKGAVVVLDADNADIRAMASLPRFDPYHIGAEHTDARNHALTAVPPGSIFKTVTMAAALEAKVTTWGETFQCNGHYGKYGLKCWKEGGHGKLTLEQAYAQSCNIVFAELAERLDPAWLQITAERLGLGRLVGWHTDKFIDNMPLRLLGEEEAGAIFLSKRTARDGGVRTGTGIGQRDVRVTPLQAANMAVAILHDGHVLSPRLVQEVRYADGDLLAMLKPQASASAYGQINPGTAALLRQGMRSVVLEGTAAKSLRKTSWPLAGKSGTAELAGKSKGYNDHWFVGYGPAAGEPRYAIAVLIEDQPIGLRNRAVALFGAIMNALRAREEQTLPNGARMAEHRTLPAGSESTD